jgi:hypothetical protein
MQKFFSCGEEEHPLSVLIGKCVFIRTVTYHLVGRVVALRGDFAALADASWIADSGRFSDTISKGTLSEVEPVGDAYVNLGSVTDIFPWNHPLPDKQL